MKVVTFSNPNPKNQMTAFFPHLKVKKIKIKTLKTNHKSSSSNRISVCLRVRVNQEREQQWHTKRGRGRIVGGKLREIDGCLVSEECSDVERTDHQQQGEQYGPTGTGIESREQSEPTSHCKDFNDYQWQRTGIFSDSPIL